MQELGCNNVWQALRQHQEQQLALVASEHKLVLSSSLAAGAAALECVADPICAHAGATNPATQTLPHPPHACHPWPRAFDVTSPSRVQRYGDFGHGRGYDVRHHPNAHVVQFVISTLLRKIPAAQGPQRVHVWHHASDQCAVLVTVPVHRLQVQTSIALCQLHDGLGLAGLQVLLPLAERPVCALSHGCHGGVLHLLPRAAPRTVYLAAPCAIVLVAVAVEATQWMDAHHSLHKHTHSHQNPWWTCKMHV